MPRCCREYVIFASRQVRAREHPPMLAQAMVARGCSAGGVVETAPAASPRPASAPRDADRTEHRTPRANVEPAHVTAHIFHCRDAISRKPARRKTGLQGVDPHRCRNIGLGFDCGCGCGCGCGCCDGSGDRPCPKQSERFYAADTDAHLHPCAARSGGRTRWRAHRSARDPDRTACARSDARSHSLPDNTGNPARSIGAAGCCADANPHPRPCQQGHSTCHPRNRSAGARCERNPRR